MLRALQNKGLRGGCLFVPILTLSPDCKPCYNFWRIPRCEACSSALTRILFTSFTVSEAASGFTMYAHTMTAYTHALH